MEIEIFCEGKIILPYKGITRSKINGFIKSICGYLKLKNKSVTIIITDNNYIRKLNKKYRKKDYATDVISFYYEDEPFPEIKAGKKHLGDLYLSLEKAFSQAADYGSSLQDEIKRLLTHGILHLLGFDHELSKEDDKRMRAREEKILRAIQK